MARKPVLLDERGYRKFGMHDKLGYMFGALANSITFIFSIVFLLKFYTDVLGLSTLLVCVVMVVARIVGGIADLTVGRICDRRPRHPAGKFKPWLMRMCIPAALASFVMYLPDMGQLAAFWTNEVRIAWLIITYLLWSCFCFNRVHIPYGAMISSVTPDAGNRLSLSIFRSIGNALAFAIVCAVLPMIIFESVKLSDSVTVLLYDSQKVITAAAIVSLLSVIGHVLCCKLIIERDETDSFCGEEKPSAVQNLKSAFSNRATLSMTIAFMLMLAVQVSALYMTGYVYPAYYQDAAMQSLGALAAAIAMILAAIVAKPFAVHLGKAEVGALSSFSGAVVCVLIWLLKPSVYVYMVLSTLLWLYVGMFSAVCWAMICDVIDHAELNSGIREDGCIYGICAFAGKLGQAIAIGLCGLLISFAGYQDNSLLQAQSVKDGIFAISCILPAVCMFLLAIVLRFWYPLRKAAAEENSQLLKRKRRR